MILLSEFILPIDIKSFIDTFWKDKTWYERFLCEHLEGRIN